MLTGAATVAVAAPVLVVAGPAAPQNWQYHGNATAGAPDFTAGSTLSPASPFRGTGYYGYFPGYAYAPRYLYVLRYDYKSRR